MGGRLLDYFGQGLEGDLPLAADMPDRIAPGASAFYYAKDVSTLYFFNDTTVAWDQLDIASLTGLFADLTDVDWSTPPTDGQLFVWDETLGKLKPVDFPESTDDDAVKAIVGAMILEGAGVSIVYDAGAGTVTIASTGGLDAEAVRDLMGTALAAGAGISITPDDGGDLINIACTVTQYTDEMARDAIATALTAGNGILKAVDDAGDTITLEADPEFIRDTIGATLVAGAGVTLTVSDVGDTITIAASGGSSTPWYFDPPVATDFPTSYSSDGTSVTKTDDADLGLVVHLPSLNVAGDKIRGCGVAPPAGVDWTVTFRCQAQFPMQVALSGLAIYDSVQSRVLLFGAFMEAGNTFAGNIRVSQYSMTAFSAHLVALATPDAMNPWWGRVVYVNATNTLEFWYSTNGKYWTRFITTLRTTWVNNMSLIGPVVTQFNSNYIGSHAAIFSHWTQSW